MTSEVENHRQTAPSTSLLKVHRPVAELHLRRTRRPPPASHYLSRDPHAPRTWEVSSSQEHPGPFLLGAASETLFSFCVRLPCAQVPCLVQSLGAQCSARWAWGKKEPPSLTLILNSPAVALVSGVLCAGLEALEPLCNFGIWELMFWISNLLQINVTCRTGGRAVELPD